MAMTSGYSEYACDVQECSQRDYAMPDTDKADSYVERHRFTDDGVERTVMLCADHNKVYSALVKACEEAYTAFERDGSYTLATQAEVDALTAQLEQAKADYEAVRKNRDYWVKRYNALEKEFEEYKKAHPAEDGEE